MMLFCACGAIIFSAIAVCMIIDRQEDNSNTAFDSSISSEDSSGNSGGFSTTSTSNVENLPADTASTRSATATTTASNTAEPANDEFVRVVDYIPDVCVDLRYATENNFTGEIIYTFDEAYLRYGTVKKLRAVQDKLKENGLGLKIWDAFRPVAAQFKLWEICPDPKYVSDPNKKFSSHSRGNTVDVTLVDAEGAELAMPTGFDDFTELADRDYSDVKSKAAKKNVLLLENTMTECGFKPYSGEWWHFSDTTEYDAAEDFMPSD